MDTQLSAFRAGLTSLAAMFFTMIAAEAAGFLYFGIAFRFTQMALALAIALAVAAALAAAITLVCRLIRQLEAARPRLVSFFGAIALLYLILALWLRLFFLSNPWWTYALGLGAGLALTLVFARFIWSYLTRTEPGLADAWFASLPPVAAIGAGLYSVCDHHFSEPGAEKTLCLLGLLLALAAAQYLAVRFVYARRRQRFAARARLVHRAVIALVPIAAAAGCYVQYRSGHRPAAASADAPPVILLSIDTLRADNLSRYNPGAPPTPGFDGFARDAVRFEHAVSPSSWTPSAVGAMMTGLYPSACNAGTLLPQAQVYNYSGPLFAAKNLGEAFQEAGYNTAVFTHNPWIMPSHGYDGFDHFEMGNDPVSWPRFRMVMGLDFLQTPFKKHYHNARKLNLQALEWLQDRPAGPFFLWVHYIDPHLPYKKHKEFPPQTEAGPLVDGLAGEMSSARIRTGYYNLDAAGRRRIGELYNGEVRYSDAEIAFMLEQLKALGLYDRSVIVITSDHGEELWDHGGFEHGHTFYDEIIRVPLLVKLPGGRHAGATVPAWVSTLWIGRTMLEAAGAKATFPGHSLLGCLADPACGAGNDGRVWLSERTLYNSDPGALVTREGIKAYFHADGTVNCFDLAADPGERAPRPENECPWPPDLPAPREVFKQIQAENRKIFDALGGGDEPQQRSTPEELRRLRALGYVK